MYKRYTLNNGIRIVYVKIPHFRSVTMGLWFKAGSIYEHTSESGLSHFIEHMLFKGTEHRTARHIAQTMDAVGGQINAFTAKECTCFYYKVMDEHLDVGLDLLGDMILNSVFDPLEIEKERGVILEEIFMYEDSPEDLVHDLLADAIFGSHPLSQSILGVPEGIVKYERNQIVSFYNSYYHPGNMVISAVGNFDETELINRVEDIFGRWNSTATNSRIITPPQFQSDVLYRHKDIEQIHFCLGCKGIEMGREENYPLLLLNTILGGGMSSRLFQSIREDRGLAYSVYSYPSSYSCAGLLTIYAGMKPAQATEVLDLIIKEINRISMYGITEAELELGKEQLKGNYILGIESIGSIMNANGRSELLLGRVTTPEEVLDKINRISMNQVMDVIRNTLGSGILSAALVGPVDLSLDISAALREMGVCTI